jgi:hypothetical protein
MANFCMRSVRSMLYFLCLKILSICLNLTSFVGELHAGHENARIAQLVEHDLAKVGVAGSSPVSRSAALHVVLAINFSLRKSSCVWAETCYAFLIGVDCYVPVYNVQMLKGATPARVVELVDTQDLKSCGHLSVRVQVPPLVHSLPKYLLVLLYEA